MSNVVKEGMTLIDFRYSREVGLFRDAGDVRVINDPISRRAAKKINEILPQLQYLIEDTQLDEVEAKKVRPTPARCTRWCTSQRLLSALDLPLLIVSLELRPCASNSLFRLHRSSKVSSRPFSWTANRCSRSRTLRSS